MNQSKIISFLFIGLLSISSSPIIARSLMSSATVISFWRMMLASLVLWIYSFLFYKNSKSLSKKSRVRTFFAGVLLGIHFILFYQAVKITTIANATFLGTLAPFFTLIYELFYLKRRYKRFIYLGMLLASIGTIFILYHDFDISNQYTLGNIYAILCSLCLSISFLIAEKVRETEGTIEYTRMLYFIAAVSIFFIGIFYTESFIVLDSMEINGFIFLALVPTILGHNIFYHCLKYTSPTIVATIPLGEPIIASLIAFLIWGNEPMNSHTIIGGFLCIMGIFIILRNRIDKDKVTI